MGERKNTQSGIVERLFNGGGCLRRLSCTVLLCGIACVAHADTKDVRFSVLREERQDTTYEAAKPATLQGERPVMPLKVEAGALKLTFSGYAQGSYIYNTRSNTFTTDRLIMMFNAQIIERLRLFMMYDFRGASLHEVYGQYDFCPEIKVRMGQYKQPFMLENIVSPTKLNNLQLNPLARFMAGMSEDPGMGKTAGRDLGLMITGDLFPKDGRRLVNYSLGVFNGCGRGNDFRDNNTQKDVIGMVNYLATQELMFTTSFVVGTCHAKTARDGVYEEDQNYRRRRICAGFEWTGKKMHLRSEYVYGLDNHTHSQGVYLSGDVHLLPKFDFVFNYDYLDTGNLGARVSTDYIYANNRTHTFVGGLSYTIYKLCRIVTEYTYTMPDFGEATHLWQTQLQVRF